MSRPVHLRSALDPVAVALRLKAAMERRPADDAGLWVVGSGTEARMRLRVVRRRVRNSFAPVLVATMTADGGGTLIEGRIGASRGVKLFMGVWFGILLLVLALSVPVLAMLTVAARGAPGAFVVLPVLGGVPLALLGFGVLLVTLGRRMSRGDAETILAFLAAEIGAREAA